MPSRHCRVPGLTGLLVLLMCTFAAAATPTANLVPDTPTTVVERSSPVSVEHEGTDTIGAKLAYDLKDLFNSSSLFTLTEKDEAKLMLLISTTPEFPSRPAMGSAYTVIWVFHQGEGTFKLYLDREVGIITPEESAGLGARLAQKTDGIAVKYGYLFKK